MLLKKGRGKNGFTLGGAPALAASEPVHVFEADMVHLERREPIKVRLENVSWILSEGREKDGSTFQFLIGLPMKDDNQNTSSKGI